MAFGLSVLRWSPREFWRATPRELIAAATGLRGGPPAAAPSAQELAALMRAFPDRSPCGEGRGGVDGSIAIPSLVLRC
jgi:uncharacterized phage protein (TIGR02216 family)